MRGLPCIYKYNTRVKKASLDMEMGVESMRRYDVNDGEPCVTPTAIPTKEPLLS